jgi:DNA repair protein RecN (Recombination protein N)
MADLWSFQRKEIDAAALKPGEDAQLEQERVVLRNVAKLQENANAAYAALYEARRAFHAASNGAEEAGGSGEDRWSLQARGGDAKRARPSAWTKRRMRFAIIWTSWKRTPSGWTKWKSRLALIERLKRKYGITASTTCWRFWRTFERRWRHRNGGRTQGQAGTGAGASERGLSRRAAALTKARKAAAEKLAKKVETELDSLALESAVFRIEVREANWSENGADRVEFLISANAGEEPRALDKVASGGELSRIALALKTSLGSRARRACSGRWCSMRSTAGSAAAWRKRWGAG